MRKTLTPFLLAAVLTMAAPAAWSADQDSSGWVASGSASARYTESTSRLDSSLIRLVAHQSTGSQEAEVLSPNAIVPAVPIGDALEENALEELPAVPGGAAALDNFELPQNPGTLPADNSTIFNPNIDEPAIPGAEQALDRLMSDEAQPLPPGQAEKLTPPATPPVELAPAQQPPKKQLPSLDSPGATAPKSDTAAGKAADKEASKNAKMMTGKKQKGSGLKLSTTRIDRFGNIGYIGLEGTRRMEDGSIVGTPYNRGSRDFHPLCFPTNPTMTRTAPPNCAFGEDGYGNVLTGYEGLGCGYGCGYGDCGYGCGYDCGYGCGYGAEYIDDGCGTGCVDGCGCDGGAGCYDEGCGCDTGCGYGCTGCCWGYWGCCPGLLYLLRGTEFEVGVFGMQDPIDFDNKNNNFGYDLALNWSTPLSCFCGVGIQAGARFTGMDKQKYPTFSGATGADIIEENRDQTFFTGGLFFRRAGGFLNFGAVYDNLRDKAWGENYSLSQIRAELSCAVGRATDIGFRGAFAGRNEAVDLRDDLADGRWERKANSYYTGFIRHTFSVGSEAMIFGGATKDSEGLIGTRFDVPITNHSSLRSSFTYVFPNSDKEKRLADNAWSVNLAWVVFLGGSSHAGIANDTKPMFDVADNSTFLQTIGLVD